MTTTIRVQRNTLKEILDSIDELVQFSEGSSIDLNIRTEEGRVMIYVRLSGYAMVHELIPSDDVEISVDGQEKISLNPNMLREVVRKADEGILEIEFLEHDYVVRYEDEEIFSEPLTLRLTRFVDSVFEDLPEFRGLARLGTLDRTSLSRALDIMSSVSPVVKVLVENGLLTLEVRDKVSGKGGVSPKLTNPEIDEFESWYSIGPPIRFLRKTTSGDEVELFVTPEQTLLLQVESPDKISRLYVAEQVKQPS